MKRVPLTKGKVALVDDIDYDYLMQWKWRVSDRYAKRDIGVHERCRARSISMHRAIAERMLLTGRDIDHIDGNGLNNCRHNLRAATKSQNAANSSPRRCNTSGYKGVTWDKAHTKWRAQITYQAQQIYLGCFTDVVDAARAYNEAALKYFGDFAHLNPIPC